MKVVKGRKMLDFKIFEEEKLSPGFDEVLIEVNVQEYLEKIIVEGMEHHMCIVHGDIKKELQLLSKLLGVNYI